MPVVIIAGKARYVVPIVLIFIFTIIISYFYTLHYDVSYKLQGKKKNFISIQFGDFTFLEGNCTEMKMISETKELLKVNGLDFDCEPLGK